MCIHEWFGGTSCRSIPNPVTSLNPSSPKCNEVLQGKALLWKNRYIEMWRYIFLNFQFPPPSPFFLSFSLWGWQGFFQELHHLSPCKIFSPASKAKAIFLMLWLIESCWNPNFPFPFEVSLSSGWLSTKAPKSSCWGLKNKEKRGKNRKRLQQHHFLKKSFVF